MQCLSCGSANVAERLERTAQGYRRFRCRECGRQFNERTAGVLNRTQYPSDVIALVVLWRLRYRLTLRDLSEMFLAMAQSRLPPANTPAPAAAVGYNVQTLGPAVMLGANWQPWGAGVNWTESVEWPSGRK